MINIFKMEKNEKIKTPNRKHTSPTPINGFLSLKKLVPFEDHPSARGLMKECNTNELKSVYLEYNNNQINKNVKSKNSSSFQFVLNPIEEKLYQNEIYYEKNENSDKINSDLNNPIEKKSTFTKEEDEFDKEITNSIIRKEKSEVIINKFENFANIKNSNSDKKDG